MAYGLQIFNPGGTLVFDSTQATGGVCLGYYTVPSGGGSIAFPEYPTEAGLVLGSGGGDSTIYTTDYALGYLRFNFSNLASGSTQLLFAY